MTQLAVDERLFRDRTEHLLGLLRHMASLEAMYQKLVAEIVLLRLLSLIESTLESIAAKLLCGAQYLDGTPAKLLHRSTSSVAALADMRSFGRRKSRGMLKWLKIADIKDNVRFLIDGSDHFVTVLDHHSSLLEEMRRVRNRVAHISGQARAEFRSVVMNHYGAFRNAVTPGVLLLSPRRSPVLIEEYIVKAQILLRYAVKL